MPSITQETADAQQISEEDMDDEEEREPEEDPEFLVGLGGLPYTFDPNEVADDASAELTALRRRFTYFPRARENATATATTVRRWCSILSAIFLIHAHCPALFFLSFSTP